MGAFPPQKQNWLPVGLGASDKALRCGVPNQTGVGCNSAGTGWAKAAAKAWAHYMPETTKGKRLNGLAADGTTDGKRMNGHRPGL